jgi:hypothetical protein
MHFSVSMYDYLSRPEYGRFISCSRSSQSKTAFPDGESSSAADWSGVTVPLTTIIDNGIGSIELLNRNVRGHACSAGRGAENAVEGVCQDRDNGETRGQVDRCVNCDAGVHEFPF